MATGEIITSAGPIPAGAAKVDSHACKPTFCMREAELMHRKRVKNNMKISCVIPTVPGKRVVELAKIVAYVTPFFDEVIVQPDTGSSIYTRFEGIIRARNDVIYTQDDDCLVVNIKDLIGQYAAGIITANAKADRLRYYQRLCDNKIALIGYGAVFDKNLIDKMAAVRLWLGDDVLFNVTADRVFTWLNEKKYICHEKSIQDFPAAMRGISNAAGHQKALVEIVNKLKEYDSHGTATARK